MQNEEPASYDGFGAPIYGQPGTPDGPPIFTIEHPEDVEENPTKAAIIVGFIVLGILSIAIAIPITWGLAWLISNWP